jgi:hypothetical protein
MMNAKKNGTVSTLPSATDIQETLWEQVQGLRNGKTTPANANAVSNAIGKMFTGVKLQMEYYRMTGETPEFPFLLTSKE